MYIDIFYICMKEIETVITWSFCWKNVMWMDVIEQGEYGSEGGGMLFDLCGVCPIERLERPRGCMATFSIPCVCHGLPGLILQPSCIPSKQEDWADQHSRAWFRDRNWSLL